MKNFLLSLALIVGVSQLIVAQTIPTIGTVGNTTNVNKGSNANYIIVNGISDGDNGSQTVALTVTSSNTSIISVTSVVFTSGQPVAIINFQELGTAGTANISVSGTDLDGTFTKSFPITVGDFYPNGIFFNVYDVIFWKKVVPTPSTVSALTSVISSIVLPSNPAVYSNLFLPNMKTDFPNNTTNLEKYLTTMYTGYLIPPATGVYTFNMTSTNEGIFSIGTNISPDDDGSDFMIVNPNTVSSRVGSRTLTGGNMYKFKCVYWTIENADMILNWSGPGLTGSAPVSSTYTKLYKDFNKPTSPTTFAVQSKGVTFANLTWAASLDNVNGVDKNTKVVGYTIYQNGVKLMTTAGLNAQITGLTSSTGYSFLVTGFDVVGNESLPSNKLPVTTYGADNTNPLPPTSIVANVISDMSASISWSGATDVGSEVVGYYVYVDGNLYNTKGSVLSTTLLLKVLSPNTVHTVMIKSLDGGGNTSAGSNLYTFTTAGFNPLTTTLGVMKAQVNLSTNSIGRNEGLGINASYQGAVDNALWSHLKPSLSRWGGIPANAFSFSTYSGAGKTDTYGKFIKHAFANDAYAGVTTGIQDDTDWRMNINTFKTFIEYVNGPASSPGGAIRAAEGEIEPYLKKGKGIIIDLGTEVWGGYIEPGQNGTQHHAQIGRDYLKYGAWCRSVAGIIKKSPYYDPTKMFITYSGRNPTLVDSYGLHQSLVTNADNSIDWISVSGYMGGNFDYGPSISRDQSDLNYYREGFKLLDRNVEGMKDNLGFFYNKTGKLFVTNFYESNMTTADYNGRLGQAVIMTDYLLETYKWGGAMAGLFNLTGGEWRMIEPSEGNRPLPLFETTRLINFYTKGNILGSDVVSASKPLDETDKVISTLAPVGVHFSSYKGKYALVLSSRDFANDYQVQLKLPTGVTLNSTAKKYVVSGTDFNTKYAVVDSATTALPLVDNMFITVPKNSMVLLVFGGTDLNQKLLPLGFSRYRRATSITVTPTNNKDISVPSGSAEFKAEVFPADAINKAVAWTLVNQANIAVDKFVDLAAPNTMSGLFRVLSNGECSGNGVVSVKAINKADTTLSLSLVVTISGQIGEGVESCDLTPKTLPGVVATVTGGTTIEFPTLPTYSLTTITAPAGFLISLNSITGFSQFIIIDPKITPTKPPAIYFMVISSNSSITSGVITVVSDLNIPRFIPISASGDGLISSINSEKVFTLSNIEISPNPSVGVFNVVSNDVIESYKVINNIGGILFTDKNINSQSLKLDLTSLPNGMYLLEIETINGVKTRRKIIKE